MLDVGTVLKMGQNTSNWHLKCTNLNGKQRRKRLVVETEIGGETAAGFQQLLIILRPLTMHVSPPTDQLSPKTERNSSIYYNSSPSSSASYYRKNPEVVNFGVWRMGSKSRVTTTHPSFFLLKPFNTRSSGVLTKKHFLSYIQQLNWNKQIKFLRLWWTLNFENPLAPLYILVWTRMSNETNLKFDPLFKKT